MLNPFPGKLPQFFDVGKEVRVLEIEEKAFLRIFGIGFKRRVEKLELLEVGQDDEEYFFRRPGIGLCLHDVVHVVERHPRGFCLDKELGAAVYSEVVIRAEGCFRGKFHDHVALMGRLPGLVLDVLAEGLEEGIEEVDPDLGFGVALGEVMVLVLLELRDQGLNVFLERLKIGHSAAPRESVTTLGAKNITTIFQKQEIIWNIASIFEG